MSIIASSKRCLDAERIAEKQENRDYAVTLSPVFEFAGQSIAIVLDGHHSLAAAKLDGVDPEYITMTATDPNSDVPGDDCDEADIDDFLIQKRGDSDYYNIATGRNIW